jgi:hypothetical protein
MVSFLDPYQGTVSYLINYNMIAEVTKLDCIISAIGSPKSALESFMSFIIKQNERFQLRESLNVPKSRSHNYMSSRLIGIFSR